MESRQDVPKEKAAPPALAWAGAGDESRGRQCHTLPLLLGDKAAIFPGSGNTGESLSLQETLGWVLANQATRVSLGGRRDSRAGGPKELGMSLARRLSRPGDHSLIKS